MFGMGAGELILILVIALLVFGPKKLPDLAKGIGKALREFRRASSDLQEQLSVDHELGAAVREVQAAASGAPSPAELAAARRAYDVELAPTVPAEVALPPEEPLVPAPAESPAPEALTAAVATVTPATAVEASSSRPPNPPAPVAPSPAPPAGGESPAKG